MSAGGKEDEEEERDWKEDGERREEEGERPQEETVGKLTHLLYHE